MPRFKHTAHRVSLTAMFATMTLLFLYLSSIIPVLRITLYFLSSVFIMGLLLEDEVSFALIMFVGVSLLSLLLKQLFIFLRSVHKWIFLYRSQKFNFY